MRIRRDISSVPFRSAGETWDKIVELVTGTGSRDVHQLRGSAGVMASIITDEHLAKHPILLEGGGSQLRIYCSYGMKAIEDGARTDSLNWNPTAGDWTMHVPCDEENLNWVRKSLAASSSRIKVFDLAKSDRFDNDEPINKNAGLIVDWNIRGNL